MRTRANAVPGQLEQKQARIVLEAQEYRLDSCVVESGADELKVCESRAPPEGVAEVLDGRAKDRHLVKVEFAKIGVALEREKHLGKLLLGQNDVSKAQPTK